MFSALALSIETQASNQYGSSLFITNIKTLLYQFGDYQSHWSIHINNGWCQLNDSPILNQWPPFVKHWFNVDTLDKYLLNECSYLMQPCRCFTCTWMWSYIHTKCNNQCIGISTTKAKHCTLAKSMDVINVFKVMMQSYKRRGYTNSKCNQKEGT
jgi:hypothetical protein